jgi:hypothetical protein
MMVNRDPVASPMHPDLDLAKGFACRGHTKKPETSLEIVTAFCFSFCACLTAKSGAIAGERP